MDPNTLVTQPAEWWGTLKNRVYRLLMEVRANGLDLLASGWVQTSEYGQPHLYLVTSVAEPGQTHDGYRIIQSIIRSNNINWINLSEIKLIGPSTLLARGILDVAQRDPDGDGTPILCVGNELGGIPIVGRAFVYALPRIVPATGN